MQADVLKEFLISLGFQVDGAGANRFMSVITDVTDNIVKLGATVEGAATSVVLFTTKIASEPGNRYWASQLTGATVEGIKAIGYAASQTESSASAAQGESMTRFMRSNPGTEGGVNRLGVQTRDAGGNMRDIDSMFTGVGSQLSKMPDYRTNQYTQMLGIDKNTLVAMQRDLGQFSDEYTAMAKAIGFNADQAAVQSNRFMTSLGDFGMMAGRARDKIGANLAGGLAGPIDNFRQQIIDSFPKMENTLTRVVKGTRSPGAKIMDWSKGLMDDGFGGVGSDSANGTPPQPTASGAALLSWMRPAMAKLENLFHLPDGLSRSVAIAESSGNPTAESNAGAQGLFGIMPTTVRGPGLRGGEAFDPIKSAEAVARYLSQMPQQNGGNQAQALASYNWDIGNVQRYGMALMPQETRSYVPRVVSNIPGGGVQMETNINIYGVDDPMRAAREVGSRVEQANSRAANQFRSGQK